MIAQLQPGQLQALRELDSCVVANSIEVFHRRLRNEGFADSRVRCFTPELGPMVGYAATLRVRGSAPPIASEPYPDRTDWWDYVLSVPAPRIVVIEDVATRPGTASLIGGLHRGILGALGCAGVVTNGAVRDLPDALAQGFHTFAGGLTVSHGYVHIVDFGQDVEVGGMEVRSGTLLHGDLHGVQTVPAEIAAAIPDAARRLRAREQEILALCRSGTFSVERLRELIERQAVK